VICTLTWLTFISVMYNINRGVVYTFWLLGKSTNSLIAQVATD